MYYIIKQNGTTSFNIIAYNEKWQQQWTKTTISGYCVGCCKDEDENLYVAHLTTGTGHLYLKKYLDNVLIASKTISNVKDGTTSPGYFRSLAIVAYNGSVYCFVSAYQSTTEKQNLYILPDTLASYSTVALSTGTSHYTPHGQIIVDETDYSVYLFYRGSYVKLDPTGTPIWAVDYSIGAAHGISQDEYYVYVLIYNLTGDGSFDLCKIDKSTGSLTTLRSFRDSILVDEENVLHKYIYSSDNNALVYDSNKHCLYFILRCETEVWDYGEERQYELHENYICGYNLLSGVFSFRLIKTGVEKEWEAVVDDWYDINALMKGSIYPLIKYVETGITTLYGLTDNLIAVNLKLNLGITSYFADWVENEPSNFLDQRSVVKPRFVWYNPDYFWNPETQEWQLPELTGGGRYKEQIVVISHKKIFYGSV